MWLRTALTDYKAEMPEYESALCSSEINKGAGAWIFCNKEEMKAVMADRNIFNKEAGATKHAAEAAKGKSIDRMDSEKIVGYGIRNPQGEDLGKVDNLMINLRQGVVEYAVVEFGSFLGLGGKLFAIPFTELKADPDNKVFILDRSKEYLKEAPGFDKDHWPDTNDHSYFNNVSMYYGSYLPPFP